MQYISIYETVSNDKQLVLILSTKVLNIRILTYMVLDYGIKYSLYM